MNKLIIAIALLATLSAAGSMASAETDAFPYALDPIKDSGWIAGDLALYGTSLYLDSIKPFGDPGSLDSSNIPWFDRLYSTNHSAALGTTADVLVIALAALPAVDLPGLDMKQILTLGTIYAETLGLAYSLDESLKSVVQRYRPYTYSSPPPSDIASLDASSSFPSRHATLAFASAVFAGSVFDELHPDSPYRAYVWAGGLGVATLISSLRVVSGDHFLSDVVSGAAIGALVGFGLPFLHKAARHAPGEAGLSLSATPDSLVVTLSFEP